MGKRLWILNHYALSPDMPGGTRHYELGRHLAELGYDVTILASSFHYAQRRETRHYGKEPWQTEQVDGVTFVWLRTFPYEGNNWRRVLNMASYMVRSYCLGRRLPGLSSTVPKPDVIIGSSVHLLAVVSAWFLARHFRASFVMEVRDLWPQTLVDMGALTEGSLLTRLLRGLETHLYRQAERIIILLPRAKEYISRLGIDVGKVRWIPNGVDVSQFSAHASKPRPHQPFTVTYVGAHGRANNLDVVLDAAKEVEQRVHASVHFTFVGDGPEKQRLKAYSKNLNLSNVEFRDPVSKESIPEELAKTDALVFVLRDVGVFKYGISSNKLFDYLASAKPVLFACDTPNNMVEETGAGVSVPPENPAALADAIVHLYEMPPDQRAAMGQRGRAYVEQHHDYALLARRLMHLLDEL
jgi:glycosyltransferase involved in cell wall biosynthesis